MRKKEVISLSDAIGVFLKENSLEQGVNSVRVQQIWNKVVGDKIMPYIESVKFRETTLEVKLKSSVLRQELLMRKIDIISLINNELCRDLVKEIVFY